MSAAKGMTTMVAPRTLAYAAVATVVLGAVDFAETVSGVATDNRETVYWAIAHIGLFGALIALAPLIAGLAGSAVYAGFARGPARGVLWAATVLTLVPLPLIGLYTGAFFSADALRTTGFFVLLASMGTTAVASVAAFRGANECTHVEPTRAAPSRSHLPSAVTARQAQTGSRGQVEIWGAGLWSQCAWVHDRRDLGLRCTWCCTSDAPP